ncbi:class I SAM-dependent methyltransferase [Rhodovulum sp. 12E13]|uniref:class I SAM-dependent methyltransferase n=1 Tax=Rhodovulum sp. 12E13 TaxID=2203891 RepID=UPI000E14DF5F|nr:class I SAM-dependent methyltransferase [Rhodovulum sp. 12E13]RDC68011.1 class I SAM-dependent methyltransferase [Rhodovulum sp. 12E13]
MSVEGVLKSGYVATARRVERVMATSGLGPVLDARASRSKTVHWLRSLTAIHDLEAMIRLDVPWWTYRAIDRVEGFLRRRPGARVFEYGSGASTIWLSRRAGQVTSIEHHADWHARMQAALAVRPEGAKVDLRLVTPDAVPDPNALYRSAKAGTEGRSFAAYARSIDTPGELFDMVVVDGRARPACLRHALKRLAPDGLIVFDNSNRSRYRASLASAGLPVRRFPGRAPALPHSDETALLGHLAS